MSISITAMQYIKDVYENIPIKQPENNDLEPIHTLKKTNQITLATRDKIAAWIDKLIDKNPDDDISDLENDAEILLKNLFLEKPNTRFRFNQLTNRSKLINAIFELSFDHNPEKIISSAQAYDSNLEKVYSNNKKEFSIILPRKLSSFFSNYVVKAVFSGCLAFYTFGKLRLLIQFSNNILVARAVPLLINKAPIEMIRAGNLMADVASKIKIYVNNNYYRIILLCSFLSCLKISYITTAATRVFNFAFQIIVLMPRETFFEIFFTTVNIVSQGSILFTKISDTFDLIADKNKNERLQLYHKKSAAVWQNLFKNMNNRFLLEL